MPILTSINSSNSFTLYTMHFIDCAAKHGPSKALYSEKRRHLSLHLCLHKALSFWWFNMHSLSLRAENYTACFHNLHLNVAFCEKVGIIALCLCTCVIPESQKTLLEFLWKARKSLLLHGSSSGLKWQQYSGISNDSWILREASGYTSPHVIFTFVSKSQRGKSEREASVKCVIWILLVRLASTLHHARYEVNI